MIQYKLTNKGLEIMRYIPTKEDFMKEEEHEEENRNKK